ncbi:MAG: hypothetical protein GQ574_03010 [Crocinitomix sp.]|nr:hypothetical protein [Crocinitomix sp.]
MKKQKTKNSLNNENLPLGYGLIHERDLSKEELSVIRKVESVFHQTGSYYVDRSEKPIAMTLKKRPC